MTVQIGAELLDIRHEMIEQQLQLIPARSHMEHFEQQRSQILYDDIVELQKNILLRLQMVIERGLGDPTCNTDIIHRYSIIALLSEQNTSLLYNICLHIRHLLTP